MNKIFVFCTLTFSSVFLIFFNQENSATEFICFSGERSLMSADSKADGPLFSSDFSEKKDSGYLFPILIIIFLIFITAIILVVAWKAFNSENHPQKVKEKKEKKGHIFPYFLTGFLKFLQIKKEEEPKKESKIQKRHRGNSFDKDDININNINIFNNNIEKNNNKEPEIQLERRNSFNRRNNIINTNIPFKIKKEYKYYPKNVNFQLNDNEKEKIKDINVGLYIPKQMVFFNDNNYQNIDCLKRILTVEDAKALDFNDPLLRLLANFYGINDKDNVQYERFFIPNFIKENVSYKKYHKKCVKSAQNALSAEEMIEEMQANAKYNQEVNDNCFFAMVFAKEKKMIANKSGRNLDISLANSLNGYLNFSDAKKTDIAITKKDLMDEKILKSGRKKVSNYETEQDFFDHFFCEVIKLLFPDAEQPMITGRKCKRFFDLNSARSAFVHFFSGGRPEEKKYYLPESAYPKMISSLKTILFYTAFLHNLCFGLLCKHSETSNILKNVNLSHQYFLVSECIEKIYKTVEDYIEKCKKKEIYEYKKDK